MREEQEQNERQLRLRQIINQSGVHTVNQEDAIAINAAVIRLNFPWQDIFSAMEKSLQAETQILELSADSNRHSVRGLAETNDVNSMLTYLNQLGSQAVFSRVTLIKQEATEGKPGIRFNFEADLKTDAPLNGNKGGQP